MTAAGAISDDESIREAYQEHNAQQLRRSLIVGNVIGTVGMASGAALDYFLYPAKSLEFLIYRLGVGAFLLAMVAVLYLGRKHLRITGTKAVGILSGLAMNASFCLMIYETDGAKSPYFAGINLVIMSWATLLPWTVVETSIVCVGSLLLYTAACVRNGILLSESAFALFGFNTSFILITTTVCVGITIFLSRVRFEDFRLRHRLDAQNRQLQDLDRLKTEFFSNVSHELRTPLTLILGPVENLLGRNDALDARVHESLVLIQRNSLRLLKLINDLLALTRLDEGAEVLRRARISVAPYVKGIVESVRHLGLSKQLRIRVEEGQSVEMVADGARMEKVLLNLLTNAIKYTPAGGNITVRWRQRDAALAIEVEDTGVGIPSSDLEKVFNRFHQVQSNAATQQQGVGIGLALAKELVEQHDGTLEVESVLGKGALFRIVLPPAVAEGDALAPAFDSEESDEPFEKAFRSADRTLRSSDDVSDEALPAVGRGQEVILVADDENDMRQFVVSMLAEDYRVVQTRHGGNVLDLVTEHHPALVLLDWMMPGKDGLTVCRELRDGDAHRDLKIVLLTARIDEKSKLEALQSGADDFLTKPFSSVEVRTRIANLLRAARLQRDLRARNAELAATIEKLQHAEMMLIQSEKMNAIGSLSAGLLHEINNPLNYTLTAIAIAQRDRESLSADMQELVGDIEEGMVRIRDVITNLKTFAYPEKPGQESEVPLQEAFRDARRMTARELEDVQVEGELPPELVVKGQKTQLTHVFINLLSNASRALAESPGAGPKIITIGTTVAEGLTVIEVADNGPGVPPDILNRVFEPFFTTRSVGSGMGMGLSVCHTIVEAHGGNIRVGNRSTGGAVFTITLPLAEKDQ